MKNSEKYEQILLHLLRASPVTKPAGIYLLKVNNRNTRTSCEVCSKLTIKIRILKCRSSINY